MAWLQNNVLLPFCQPDQHRGLARRLRMFQQFDAMPREQQVAHQEKRVRTLLDHAYETCPFYRRVFDEIGFRSGDWRHGQPIPVPELTRDLVRINGEDLCSRAFRPDQLRRAMTGGTTSAPITLWRDLEGLRNKTAMQFHLNRLSGYEQGMRVLWIWGAERDLEEHPSWRWRLYQRLLGREYCGAGQLSDASFQRFLEKLNRQKSEVLFGYSNSIALFAQWLRNSGQHWHRPRIVIATAEALTHENRALIEETFEAPVNLHYGSRDVGMIAAECSLGGRLHLHPAACYVELLPAGQSANGPLYRLVVTDLLNYGMPLIRYDTADCVQFDESRCPCGSPYPSVTEVLGRTTDNLILSDGTLMPGTSIIHRAGRTFRNIRQVQLIQKAIDKMHLRYSALGDGPVVQQELSAFLSDIDSAFRTPLQWTVERVPEILRERSGKLRVTICEVPTDQNANGWKKAG